MKNKFTVNGMSCAACSSHVDKAVRSLEGVEDVNVNLLQATMFVEYDPQKVGTEDIVRAVREAGYDAAAVSNKKSEANETSRVLSVSSKKLICALILLLLLMYFGMGQMLGAKVPLLFNINISPVGYTALQFVLSSAIIIIYKKYYINGFKRLIGLSPNMDTLIASGSSVSYIYSIVSAVRIILADYAGNSGQAVEIAGNLYFESAAMILVFVSIGNLLEEKSKHRTGDAIRELMNLRPREAVRLNADGTESVIPVEELNRGDCICIRPGSQIPADGEIIKGEAVVNEAMLTGESLPVLRKFGDMVYEATFVESGYIQVKVNATGENSSIAEIIRLVDEASSSKAPVSRFADKVSSVFVPVVMGIAFITLIIWLAKGYPFTFALNFAITVLVISCPCSLGLATPTAIMVGTGIGAKHGILFRNAGILEQTHKINSVVFDKTGTITLGRIKITDFHTFNDIDENYMLRIIMTAESKSEHPIAKAFLEYAAERGISKALSGTEFINVPGRGISEIIDSKKVIIGNSEFLADNGISIPEDIINKASRYSHEGKTTLLCACNGLVSALFTVSDIIKNDAGITVNALSERNINTIMLTGDNKETALYVAKAVGIDKVVAQVLPSAKENYIAESTANGIKTAMVGDGINDAAALAKSDIGFAMGNGIDIAVNSADVVIIGNRLYTVVEAIDLSRITMKIIKENLFWALFYNCLGIPVAAGLMYESLGLKLSPMIAAACMSVSSIFVVLNALRLRYASRSVFKVNDADSAQAVNDLPSKEEKNMQVTVKIEGMMCMHCVAHVKKAFESLEGVSAEVSLENNNCILTGADHLTDAEITDIVVNAGYEVTGISRV